MAWGLGLVVGLLGLRTVASVLLRVVKWYPTVLPSKSRYSTGTQGVPKK